MRRRSPILAFALAAVLRLPMASAGEAPLATPVDGPPFRGALLGADEQWALKFDESGTPRQLAAADLATWGEFVEPRRGTRIVLGGGGIILAESLRIEREQLRGESSVFTDLELPLGSVAGLVFRPPIEPAAGDALVARILAANGQSDRVLLDNGDELTGTIAGLDARQLHLTSETGTLDIDVEKLKAVIFNPGLADKFAPAKRSIIVGFQDGSRITAVSISADPTVARLRLAVGAVLTAPTPAIVALQPLGGRAVYLSDLEPASYRHVPYLELSWPYRADRSVLGSQLRADGHVYPKGLGMHSPSRITYALDQPFRRFEALAAIDAESGDRGSVVFRVFTDDGSGNWQPRFTSEAIRGGQPPVPISVDLSGAKRISLLVDYSDRGDELDHADWLNARLVR